MKKKVLTALIAGALVAGGASAAYAGTGYTSYNTTVGKFNGSGYTGYQTQKTNGASAALESSTVGSNYKVDARVNGPKNGAWKRGVTDYTLYWLSNDNLSNSRVRVQFSTGITTSANVQVTGTWASN